MGIATLPSTLIPQGDTKTSVFSTTYPFVCKVHRAHSCFATRQFSDNRSLLFCNVTTLSPHPSLIENCADRDTISRSNLHNATYTMESTRWNLHDGNHTMETTRWNLHDVIRTMRFYKGHDIYKRHGSHKGHDDHDGHKSYNEEIYIGKIAYLQATLRNSSKLPI